MSKPTLVQSLLNQPSKSYANAADANRRKDYYSTRQEMVRIAGQKPVAEGIGSINTGRIQQQQEGTERYQHEKTGVKSSDKREPVTVMTTKGPGPPMQVVNHPRRPSSKILEPDSDSDESDVDMFFTPNTSPRASMASSIATITFPSTGRRPSRRSLSSLKSVDSAPATPVDAHNPANKVSGAVPSTRTPSGNARNALSTASSLSSTSLDGHSIFSADYTATTTEYYVSDQTVPIGRGTPVRSTSTRTSSGPSKANTYAHLGVATINGTSKANGYSANGQERVTPVQENNAQTKLKGKEKEVPRPLPDHVNGKVDPAKKLASTTTSAPAPRQQQSQPYRQPQTFSPFAPLDAQSTASSTSSATARPLPTNQRAPPSSSNTIPRPSYQRPEPSSTPSAPSNRSGRPVNNGRHFSAPVKQTPPRQSQQQSTPTSSISNGSSIPRRIVESPSPSPSPPPSNQRQQYPQRNNYAPPIPPMPTITPLIRGMDAVLEEDEDGPLTPIMEAQTLRGQADGWDWAGGGSRSSSGTPPPTSVSGTASSRLRHTTPRKGGRPRSIESNSSSTSSHSRSAPKTLTAEVEALVNSFADSDGALPSNGTQGYSSLVLPRAPPPANGGASRVQKAKEGKVDLTRSGVAQMTMATVEVVRGLGATAGGGGVLGFLGLGRRRSLSTGKVKGPAPIPIRDPKTGQVDPAHVMGLKYQEPTVVTPLGFTAYRAPPTNVPSSSVLVQVWAVGVDSVDGRLVGARFGNQYLREGVSMLGGDLELVEEPEDVEDGFEENAARGGEDVRYAANGHAHVNGNGHATETEDEGDVPSTATYDSVNSPAKKGGLAALGRSLSLRLSRGNSKKNKDLQRAVSAAARVSASPPQQNGTGTPSRPSPPRAQTSIDPSTISRPKRSFSLKRSNTAASHVSHASSVTANNANASPAKKEGGLKRTESVSMKKEKAYAPDVGYIPGRSFVGRVLECGWEVPDEAVKKGEWVVGLLDVRKGGALAEFIVVDRHRVHRVPHPKTTPDLSSPSTAKASPVWIAAPKTANGTPRAPTLTLEELALLPLCGLPAQRAVRTLDFAFSTLDNPASALHRPQSEFGNGLVSPSGERRRALVLRGHDGAGAMAVQILVKRGWRVSVHVPYSLVPANAPKAALEETTHAMEDRAREWGADEVIFDDGEGLLDDGRGAAIRVLESIRADGDVFDAVVDPIGGKDVWEAAERLLKFSGVPPRRRGVGQFTTLVGDWPDRIVPRAKDHLRSGLRAMRMGSTDHAKEGEEGKVGYAWVSVAQDVDWEGHGVSETLGSVVRMALEEGVRPPVDDVVGQMGYRRRVVPFDQSPQAFVDNGLLGNGGTVVVKIAG